MLKGTYLRKRDGLGLIEMAVPQGQQTPDPEFVSAGLGLPGPGEALDLTAGRQSGTSWSGQRQQEKW
jgi:hypothetical protein